MKKEYKNTEYYSFPMIGGVQVGSHLVIHYRFVQDNESRKSGEVWLDVIRTPLPWSEG